MHLLILWFRFYWPDGAIIQYKYPNRVYFDCKTKLCLIVPGRQEKYIFTQESFYLQRILHHIYEQDTSFLDCKHKHMMKSGAPPDKLEYLHHLHHSLVSQAKLISKGYYYLVPGLISIF